ncbi:MAG: GNAT family N-acetyltransferase [Phormidesmis sp.]
MQIELGDLNSPDVQALLREHLASMHEHSPPGCVHALDLSGLREASVTFWTVRESGELLGCGALKALNAQSGEIKSMRTAQAHLRKGVATYLLKYILNEARRRQYKHVSIETGSTDAFKPAILLYERFGFTRCGPFADYKDNAFSVFMTVEL